MMFNMGRISDYAKTQVLTQNWQQQKQNLSGFKINQQEETNPLAKLLEPIEYDVEVLSAKIERGETLSSSEMEYLSKNNPDLYEKAMRVARAREEYRRELQGCRTKDETVRLKMNKIAGYQTSADAQALVSAVIKEHVKYQKSREYGKLPTDSELAIQQMGERAKREKELTSPQKQESCGQVLRSQGEKIEQEDEVKQGEKADIEKWLPEQSITQVEDIPVRKGDDSGTTDIVQMGSSISVAVTDTYSNAARIIQSGESADRKSLDVNA